MKKKFVHKGIKGFQILNRFDECFGPGSPFHGTISEEQINGICSLCKNNTCIRAGRGRTTWESRMSSQVEYLLNDPRISDLTNFEHQRISNIDIENQKSKIEAIAISFKTDSSKGWDEDSMSIQSSIQKQIVPLPPLEVRKSEEISRENLIPPSPSLPKSVPKNTPPNTKFPTSGVMIGGGNVPSQPDKPVDPWEDADKVVKPGSMITVRSEKK